MTAQTRVLLAYREAVAQATERALADLREAGVRDPVGCLLGRPTPPPAPIPLSPDERAARLRLAYLVRRGLLTP
jgi:hypothetical protein